jgi:DNA-binding transcriptional LysR family regulator
MELRQLEYFVAVSEEASFTKAAARLHVAQPGVSAQIRQLERELGQPLFDRSGRTVRLTEVGAAVMPFARAALGAVTGARLAVDELAGLVRGHAAVGMVASCGPLGLPGLLAEFHRVHPGVEISLTEANSDVLLDGIQSGRLDVAVVGLATDPPPGIEVQVVVDEALVAAVAPDDPLAGSRTVRLDALQDRALITLTRGTGLRTAVDSACAKAGFRPRIAFEASDPNILADLAAQGLGVAILPESLGAARTADLRPLTVTAPALRSKLALAWRADTAPGPAARALIRHARAALR